MKQFRLPKGRRLWNAPGAGRETRFIHREIFEQHCYEKHGVTVSDHSVVFDVGANIGMFALSLMERFGDLRIYCFEPVPGTLACLERNLAESQRRGANQVTVVEAALGAADAETTIEFFPAAPGNSTLHSKEKHREFGDMMDVPFSALWKANKWMALFFLPVFPFRKRLYGPSFERLLADPVSIPCQVRTVSGMIRQHGVNRIDLLKIDVEGAELDVLAGIEECHWPLIRQISMEVAPANKKGVAALRDRLRAHGFAQVAADGMFGGESNLDDPLPAALYAVR